MVFLNTKGQTSVEYILLVSILALIVFQVRDIASGRLETIQSPTGNPHHKHVECRIGYCKKDKNGKWITYNKTE